MEPDRWYYHADRLGLLVWQDMPSMCGANEDTWYADCWVKNRSISEVGLSLRLPAPDVSQQPACLLACDCCTALTGVSKSLPAAVSAAAHGLLIIFRSYTKQPASESPACVLLIEPSFLQANKRQFETELQTMIEEHISFPSIVMYVVFNEGWGQYETERITRAASATDPSRLYNCASGW